MPITEPSLLLDEGTVRQNIERMAQKAAANKLELKPHFKTHQSRQAGRWFREYGIDKITVSSLKMAEFFAGDGWEDILIAFPYNPRTAKRLNKLAQNIKLSIMLSDVHAFKYIEQSIEEDVNIYIEIDTGSGRTGFLPAQQDEIKDLAQQIKSAPNLYFSGIYSHPGHSYRCRSKSEVRELHRDVLEKMQQLKQVLKPEFPNIVSCIGDTPCCSVAENFNGIDEISPGNFVFYDLMQAQIGSCSTDDIGVALACPVVATYPKRNECVVHGGAVHLSKEHLDDDGTSSFGRIVPITDSLNWGDPIRNCFVKSLSQEHGIVSCSNALLRNLSIGDMIGILPVHSCLTADTMQEYTLTGTGEPLDHLKGQA